MRFYFKVFILVLLLTGTISFAAAYAVYWFDTESQTDLLRDRVLTTARTGASFVDGDLFATLKSPEQQNSEAWRSIQKVLLRVRDATPKVKNIYSLAPTSEDGILQFVVDPDEAKDLNGNGMIDPEEEQAKLGDRYSAKTLCPGMIEGLNHAVADREFTKDKWGTFLSGYAPIRNGKGESVGVIGADITAESVETMRGAFRNRCLQIAAIVFLASALASLAICSYVNRPLRAIHAAVSEVAKGNLDVQARVTGRDEFHDLAEAFNAMVKGLKERDVIRTGFERYVSKAAVELMLKDPEKFANRVERKRITILFSDIRGFTALSDTVPPERVVEILNAYFTRMIDIVFKHNGTVDKLVGDGMMALFGTPVAIEDPEGCAVRAAIEMRDALGDLRKELSLPKLNIGIGINSGPAIVGNIGSGKTMDYTAIGDEVNLASRLEAMNKELGTQILVSDATYRAVRHAVAAERHENISVRGVGESLTVYEIKGLKDAPASTAEAS